jgi:hypothetical protein
MSYRITFSDRSQVTVDNEQGLKLMELQASVKKPEYVNIAENQYKMSTITKVMKVSETPATLPMISSGMVKRHEKSIHREIYYLYKKELTKPEPRVWEEFRAAAYDYLYSQDSEWCDDRKGTCVCKDKAVPVSVEKVKEVMDFMRS